LNETSARAAALFIALSITLMIANPSCAGTGFGAPDAIARCIPS
jgi:hypothetical protein